MDTIDLQIQGMTCGSATPTRAIITMPETPIDQPLIDVVVLTNSHLDRRFP